MNPQSMSPLKPKTLIFSGQSSYFKLKISCFIQIHVVHLKSAFYHFISYDLFYESIIIFNYPLLLLYMYLVCLSDRLTCAHKFLSTLFIYLD